MKPKVKIIPSKVTPLGNEEGTGMTNIEAYGNIPLNDVMGTVYFHDCLKGFNKGFEAWLAYPYFEHKTRMVEGKLMLQNGIRYKGYFYTRDEFEAYKRDGMLP